MSRVGGLSPTQFKSLREVLSYQADPQASYFSGGYAQKRYLLGKRGEFPTGLLYLVKEFLRGTEYPVADARKLPPARPGLFEPRLGVTPYPEQIEASETCKRHTRGIVVAPTGFGKSVIIALIITKLQVRTLIVVPSLGLKKQLTESLTKTFGVKAMKHISVQNVDALDPKVPAQFDCVIIDEFHHSGARTYRELNKKAWAGVYYKFGLTATPFRSQENERLLLESVLSKVIFRVEHETAVKKGYIVPVEAYYYDLPKQDVEGYTWNQVYNELVINNSYRNTLICNLLKRLGDFPTLCLVKEIKHGELLRDSAGVPFANGEDGDAKTLIDRFNSESGQLIGTTGVLGEGIDTKPAEYIILAGLGKSKNAFIQQIGRGFRVVPGKECCKVILFRDKSHKWTLAHFKAQVKYLKEEFGIVPSKLPCPI